MAEMTTYAGSCHCGKVRFEVTADLAGPITSCNCSICSRMGALLTFVAGAQMKMLAGEDGLADYQFGKKSIHHPFCTTCGIHPFGHGVTPDGNKMVAVNVRCLEGVDLDALELKRFDGKSI